MKTIYKFMLKITDEQEVEIPLPAKVLSVQMQPNPKGETMCLWAEVDPEAEKVLVPIVILGTGQPFPVDEWAPRMRYISTFQMHEGKLVFHAYEVAGGEKP